MNIEELKKIVRGNGFQESHGSTMMVIDVETVIDLLDELKQCDIHGVSKSLKDKHAQALFEYKQQLKETDNNDTMFIDNKEEWIRQTSILEGKITILEDL